MQAEVGALGVFAEVDRETIDGLRDALFLPLHITEKNGDPKAPRFVSKLPWVE